MTEPAELLELLRRLRDSEGGSIKRMRLLSEAWKFISALSPHDRTRLLTEAGIEGGEEMLQRFLSNPGSEGAHLVRWAEAILRALDVKALESSAVHAAKSQLSRDHAATVATVLSTVSAKLQEEKEELANDEEQLDRGPVLSGTAPPPPPSEKSDEQAEHSEEKVAAESPLREMPSPARVTPGRSETPARPTGEETGRQEPPPTPVGGPSPQPVTGPSASAGAALRIKSRPSRAEAPYDPGPELGDTPLAPLLRHLEDIPSESARFLELSRRLGFHEISDLTAARALLQSVELPWMRRRLLEAILRCGLAASNKELIGLCAEFGASPGDYLFLAGNLLDLREWTREEVELLASRAPAPYVQRLILRRARRG